ncbi:hypothetical protein HUJ05_002542 [Dendroctonus ponderosae]|nr:hypothetical protein HUJ05_002542 [Dendroctonus ponderosae]
MVSPQAAEGAIKKKKSGEDGKSASSSPEPFKEPSGMTTIDLNKLEDAEAETNAARSKSKHAAQMRYISKLLWALCTILTLVLGLAIITVLNKEFHLLPAIPISFREYPPKQPPTDFIALTKGLNEALFRDRLKSGNYLENTAMEACKLEQTLDSCCEVFRETDLEILTDYCTVNNMLSILKEFEEERRKKREIDYPDSEYDYENHFIEYEEFKSAEVDNRPEIIPPHLRPQRLPNSGEFLMQTNPWRSLYPKIRNTQNWHFNLASDPDPFEQIVRQSEPAFVERGANSDWTRSENRESPLVQSIFERPLHDGVVQQILEHITIAPKQERAYVFNDFYPETGPASQEAMEFNQRLEARMQPDSASFGNEHSRWLVQPQRELPDQAQRAGLLQPLNMDSTNNEDSYGGNDHNRPGKSTLDQQVKFLTEDSTSDTPFHLKINEEYTQGIPQKPPKVAKLSDQVKVLRNSSSDYENVGEVFSELQSNDENTLEISQKPPKVVKLGDQVKVLRNSSSDYENTGEVFSELQSNDEDTLRIPQKQPKVDKLSDQVKVLRNSSRDSENAGEDFPELQSTEEDKMGIPQKTPKVAKFGDQVKVLRNSSSGSQNGLEVFSELQSTDEDTVGMPQKPPQVAKLSDQVKVLRNSSSDSENAGAVVSELQSDDKDTLRIPQKPPKVAKLGDQVKVLRNSSSDSENTDKFFSELQSNDEDTLEIPQKPPKVAKLGDQVKVLRNSSSGSQNGLEVFSELQSTDEDTVGMPQKPPQVAKLSDQVKVLRNSSSDSENAGEVFPELQSTEEATLGILQNPTKLAKFGGQVKLLRNSSSDSENGGEDFSELHSNDEDTLGIPQKPPKVAKLSDQVKVLRNSSSDSENAGEVFPELQSTEEATLGIPQKPPKVAKFVDQVKVLRHSSGDFENASEVFPELQSTEEDKLGIPQKTPKVAKFGDQVTVLRNSSSDSENGGEVFSELQITEDDTVEIPQIPLKVAKLGDQVKVLRNSSSDSENAGAVVSELQSDDNDTLEIPQKPPKVAKLDDQVKVLRNSSNGSQNGLEVFSELQSNDEDTLGIPQKPPKVAKLGDQVKVLRNSSSYSENTGEVFSELQSNDEDMLEIPQKPPKVAKLGDQVKVLRNSSSGSQNGLEVFSELQSNDEDTLGIPQKPPQVAKLSDQVKVLRNSSSDSENAGEVFPELQSTEEATLGIPQKPPKVAKFGDQVKLLRNSSSDSENGGEVFSELHSNDEDTLGIPQKPPKVSKLGDQAKVLRNSSSESENGGEVFPDLQSTEEVTLGIPQKPPKVAKFGDQVKLLRNSSSDSENGGEVFSELHSNDEDTLGIPQKPPKVSKLGDQVKLLRNSSGDFENPGEVFSELQNNEEDTLGISQKPPKVAKLSDQVKVLRNSSSDSENGGEVFSELQSNDEGTMGIPQEPQKLSKVGDQVKVVKNTSSASENTEKPSELRSNDEDILGIPQQQPLVTKFGDKLKVLSTTSTGLQSPRAFFSEFRFNELTTEESFTTEDYPTEPLGSKEDFLLMKQSEPALLVEGDANDRLGMGHSSTTQPSLRQETELSRSQSENMRAASNSEDFRLKTKQVSAMEEMQAVQQAYTNPCFYPPYMGVLPSSGQSGAPMDSGYLKVVPGAQARSQPNPMYVINPPMFYSVPPSQSGYFLSSNSYIPQGRLVMTPSPPIQVSSSAGQYYMCNPIPTPSNNIVGLSGTEVRRESANLQDLIGEIEDSLSRGSNMSRAAGQLICPLGERSCLDNSKCIKNHYICDNEVQCGDSTDEIACTCRERVGRLRMCDGYCDCPQCEDESGCFGCAENEFSCDDWSKYRRSSCIPLSQRCDGIKQCEITGKDEMDCSILADRLGNFPINKVSNSVGFLHRNFKGKWYPTCYGTELWAAEVCQVEAGPSAIVPKTHMTFTSQPYNGLFINILPNNEIRLVNTCVQDRAAFVECPPIYCGLRFHVTNPYRDQELDTSVEDMLNDLRKAYQMREDILGLAEEQEEKIQEDSLGEVIQNLERTLKRRHVDSRVVGGRPSQPSAWPWLVSIYKNGIFHCAGVLINEMWVVTAAHCVVRYWQYYYEIQAGTLRRFSYAPMDQRRWARTIISHPDYDKEFLRNDIGKPQSKRTLQVDEKPLISSADQALSSHQIQQARAPNLPAFSAHCWQPVPESASFWHRLHHCGMGSHHRAWH